MFWYRKEENTTPRRSQIVTIYPEDPSGPDLDKMNSYGAYSVLVENLDEPTLDAHASFQITGNECRDGSVFRSTGESVLFKWSQGEKPRLCYENKPQDPK